MSKHTIKVDQFILNKLQPEIDSLNLSLISMEENGYDNIAMRITRQKLNKLISMHDFLKEYAYGNEEVDDADINAIMSEAGNVNMSTKSRTQFVQSTRNSLDINGGVGCLDYIRVYMNDKILTTDLLPPLLGFTSFKIYGSSQVTSMTVVMTIAGYATKTYKGVNHVTIQDVELAFINSISFQITTINICGQTITKTIAYPIQDTTCNTITYWLGSTVERFKISTTLLNESSDITIDPNSGTNSSGTTLNYIWVTTNPSMTEFLYREDTTMQVSAEAGDSHTLLLMPATLTVSNVEEIVSGSPVAMTEGLHYDVFTIVSPALKTYNCIYFRDLSSLTFTNNRLFQFDITKI